MVARKARVEFEGALYHVLEGGDRQQNMFRGAVGRGRFAARVCLPLIAFALATCGPCGPHRDETRAVAKVAAYNLFTWNVASGDLCYALVTEAEREAFIHRWFPKRNATCGVAELKKTLAALPRDSIVSWNNWPAKQIDYPSSDVINEIKRSAAAHRIRVELFPALSKSHNSGDGGSEGAGRICRHGTNGWQSGCFWET
jgi:hypothetical protein